MATLIQSLRDDLIAFWPLSETSGSSVASLVNNTTFEGATVGSPTWSAGTPTSGYGLTLNGSSQYVNLGNLRRYRPRNGFTIMLWFKRDATANGTVQYLAHAALTAAGAGEWMIGFDADNKLFCNPYVGDPPNDPTTLYSDSAITDENIHSVTLTWDTTDSYSNSYPVAGNWRMYVDGVEQAQVLASTMFYYIHSNDWMGTYLGVAMRSEGGGGPYRYFKGSLGACGMWARQLSVQEIAAMNVAATPLPVAVTRALINYSPVAGSTASEISALWAASPLAALIGARSWDYAITLGESGSETIPEAITRLLGVFSGAGVTPDQSHRGIILIPEDTYTLSAELALSACPYFDFALESSDTKITYSADNSYSTVNMAGWDGFIFGGHIERTSGARYAAHDDGYLAATPRSGGAIGTRFTTDNGWRGIGTGCDGGETRWFIACDCPTGIYAHNYDTPTVASPCLLNYFNCSVGEDPTLPYPCVGLQYVNYGSEQDDVLAVVGGRYFAGVTKLGGTPLSYAKGISVENNTTSYHGASETKVRIGAVAEFHGATEDVDIVAGTIVEYGQGGTLPYISHDLSDDQYAIDQAEVTAAVAAGIDSTTTILEVSLGLTNLTPANVLTEVVIGGVTGTLDITADNPGSGHLGLGL